MDFHNKDRFKSTLLALKPLWPVLSSGPSYLFYKALSQSEHKNALSSEYGSHQRFQSGQRSTATRESISSPLLHTTQSSTQVTTSVAKALDFRYRQKFNVQKSFTNKTSPFGFCLFNGQTFLLTLRSVRKPNLQYVICCCLVRSSG
jgi:hypothetical protein